VAGSTLQLSFTVFDTKGLEMSGQTIIVSTNAPQIATVSMLGQVTSVGPVGVATITASVGTVHASASVTVFAGAAASITRTSPDPGSVFPGATAGDSVRFVVKDAFGNPRAQQSVTFSVTAGGGQASPQNAQTDALGRVATMFITGSAAGANTLNATVGGATPGILSLTTVEGSVTVSSVAPSPMTPGATVTITGVGFDPAASGDAVTIDGQVAAVTSATNTELVITVPTSLPCTPAHQANVQVTANGATAIGHQTLRLGALRTLTVGTSLVLASPADVGCTELSPANARYAVNVLNTSPIPTSITPFHFAGATSIPPGTSLAPRVFMLRQSPKSPVFSRQITSIEGLESIHSVMHLQMLETNRRILTEKKNQFRRTPKRASSSLLRTSVSAAAVPAVGDIRAFRVFQATTTVGGGGTCNDFVEISARVAYVGTRAIIYEDVAAPLAGQMNDKFALLGQEFDATMYPSDANNFGDPLITDPHTDMDQHLNMVFTPAVPAGLAGFVVSCDFFPRVGTNQTSNLGENFYARVPTVPGTISDNTDNPARFMRQIRGVIVHEVKHIAAFGARLENPNTNSFEESWLEEGMAMVAEEVWSRDNVYPNATWKGNMLYQNTLFCDVRPTSSQCVDAPFVMFDHFSRLYTFLDSPGTSSLFGRVSDGDFVFYGASWSFIRYNVDRYATSEATYLRGITGSELTGIGNISQHSGADPIQILGDWSLALYLDGDGSMTGNADVNLASWNTRDIFSGMNADFRNQGLFLKAHPLVPQIVGSGDFTVDNAGIHGGSFSPYDLIGQAGNTRTIGLSAGAPGSPGTGLFRLVVARIQ
jgi:hypothetical protein